MPRALFLFGRLAGLALSPCVQTCSPDPAMVSTGDTGKEESKCSTHEEDEHTNEYILTRVLVIGVDEKRVAVSQV